VGVRGANLQASAGTGLQPAYFQRLQWGFRRGYGLPRGLTPKEEERLIKRSGVAVEIDPTVGNMFRSLISKKHRMVRGMPSQEILRKVADLAAVGQFLLTISRTAPCPARLR
jgi:hypothetical protein